MVSLINFHIDSIMKTRVCSAFDVIVHKQLLDEGGLLVQYLGIAVIFVCFELVSYGVFFTGRNACGRILRHCISPCML